jgi:hypothetical protein
MILLPIWAGSMGDPEDFRRAFPSVELGCGPAEGEYNLG